MKGNQYELAEPQRTGKQLRGMRLYKQFQPIDIPRRLLKHYREYMVYQYSGRCWACGAIVGCENLEIGHLVEKCIGGSDEWNNIRPMCLVCNRLRKPVHDTIKEVLGWRERRWKAQRNTEEAGRYIESQGGIEEVLKQFVKDNGGLENAINTIDEYLPKFALNGALD